MADYDPIPMDPTCPRCGGRHGVEVSGDGYEWDCAACGGRLMCAIGPDGGEMYPWDEDDSDECVRDDSTECDCSRCTAADDAFWRDQGEPWDASEALDPPDGMDPLLDAVFGPSEDQDERELSEAEQVGDPGFAFGGPR